MKNAIIFSFFALALLVSCNKKDVIETADQVGISKVTYYPILTVKGDEYMTVVKGSTFTDPGCTALGGTEVLTVKVVGTPNTSVVGVYVVNYSAVNKDGFSAFAKRFVVVYSTDATASTNDFSGSYARSTNGSLAIWTKIAPGVYTVFNPGGAPGTTLTVIAFNPKGFVINVPSQASSDGSITSCTDTAGGSDIVYNPGPPAKYEWKVSNPGYGTSLRKFSKQ
jgi:hypothetical protein